MRTIPLTQGQVTLVDDADFKRFGHLKWYAAKKKGKFYAICGRWRDGRMRTVRLHREILGLTDPRIKADHRDGDGLNNCRKNLREATNAENCRAFRRAKKNKTSRFRGVCFHKHSGKWAAQINANGVVRTIGRFYSEVSAANAYDRAARKAFGRFAFPNFPRGGSALVRS